MNENNEYNNDLNKKIEKQEKQISELNNKLSNIENMLVKLYGVLDNKETDDEECSNKTDLNTVVEYEELLEDKIRTTNNDNNTPELESYFWYGEPEKITLSFKNLITDNDEKVCLSEIKGYKKIIQNEEYNNDLKEIDEEIEKSKSDNKNNINNMYKLKWKSDNRKSFNFRTNYMHILEYLSNHLSISKNRIIELAMLNLFNELNQNKTNINDFSLIN